MKLLTFDIEEFYHLLGPDVAVSETLRSSHSSINAVSERILELLDRNGVKALFFFVGETAVENSDLVREVISRGHQVGSHSMHHNLHQEQTDCEFRKDLKDSIEVLSGISKRAVRAYRAPGFSLTYEYLSRFRILADEGIQCDFSVFLNGGSHGGIGAEKLRQYRADAYSYNIDGVRSYPFVRSRIGFINIPVLGGGYFRLLPGCFSRYAVKNSNYCMTYFHPRDFDPSQPSIPGLSMRRRFRSYVGLGRSLAKFEKILSAADWDDPRRILGEYVETS